MISLVLIHGFLGVPDDWREVQAALEFPSQAIEIPNRPDWETTLQAICQELDSNTVLVGYSLGARLALGCSFELRTTDRLQGLVLVSGQPGLAEPARKQRWQHDLEVCQRLRTNPRDTFIRDWYQQNVFQSLEPDQIEAFVDSRRDLDVERQVDLMMTCSVARQPDYWSQLSCLELPVAVVVGGLDPKYVEIGRRMNHELPNGEFHKVANSGHIVHREQPELFVEVVNDFCRRILEGDR